MSHRHELHDPLDHATSARAHRGPCVAHLFSSCYKCRYLTSNYPPHVVVVLVGTLFCVIVTALLTVLSFGPYTINVNT